MWEFGLTDLEFFWGGEGGGSIFQGEAEDTWGHYDYLKFHVYSIGLRVQLDWTEFQQLFQQLVLLKQNLFVCI